MFYHALRFFTVFILSATLSNALLLGQESTENDESGSGSGSRIEQVQDAQQEDAARIAETHETIEIRGWAFMLNRQLKKDEPELVTALLELMDVQLRRVEDVVPAKALQHLKTVRIWANPAYENVKPTAEYHPERDYLVRKERLPDMVHGVELTNVERFEFECTRMPYLMLHEFAHAYHDQVLGFREANIRAAFDAAEASGTYNEVDRFNGRIIVKDEAYAMSNHKEYFAEASEAYFGRNDFFPFTLRDLRKHDPEMVRVIEEAWGVDKQQDSLPKRKKTKQP